MFHLPRTKSGVIARSYQTDICIKKLSAPECHLTNSNDLNLTLNVSFILGNDLRWIHRNAQ